MAARTCCLCGARRGLRRYRAAEIAGGPAQWVCIDDRGCAERVGPDPYAALGYRCVHERDGTVTTYGPTGQPNG